MDARLENLKAKIAGGAVAFGTHTAIGGAMVGEMFGEAGFDMIWVDTEHALVSPAEAQNTLIGARAGGACAFVRVPWHDPVMAKPYLDCGADGIVFPMIMNADDARAAVAACRYPPVGTRGFGPFRALRYGAIDTGDYIRNNTRNAWAILQIEHVDAVRNLDAILAVPGIDAIVVGPCDLSASLGLLGELRHPDVLAQFDELAAKTTAAGIPLGVSMNWDEETFRDWIGRGASLVFCDNDAGYIMRGCRRTLSLLRGLVK